MRDNKGDPKKFLRTPKRKEGFFYDERIKITRKEARKHLVQWNQKKEKKKKVRNLNLSVGKRNLCVRAASFTKTVAFFLIYGTI